MKNNLKIYNTFEKKKEFFFPINYPFIGVYLCGPTVYDYPHLGHARGAVFFDILFRYFKYLNYKIKYVRNITDIGHLERNIENSKDKIFLKANLEKLNPIEISQYYTNIYRKNMLSLNVIPPSIEPTASANVIEQIELIKLIMSFGFAYESNGSIYFDLKKYTQKKSYGNLSGIILNDLIKKKKIK